MNVFISWSGESSRNVALALKEWLPDVIQAVRPFMSSEDLAKGTRWPKELSERLENISFGIACLTPENLNSPWIHFEVGALSKQLEESRVITFLVGVETASVLWPLAQFQHTVFDRDDVFRLVQSVNASLARDQKVPLSESHLKRAFDVNWDRLDTALKSVVEKQQKTGDSSATKVRSDRSILEEVLEVLRVQQRDVGKLQISARRTAAQNRAITILQNRLDEVEEDVIRTKANAAAHMLYYELGRLPLLEEIAEAMMMDPNDARRYLREGQYDSNYQSASE